MAAYQVPLIIPPATPFQKELTSWVRRPGAPLELSPERLAEAMDSGRVRISDWERNEWLVGNVRGADSPGLVWSRSLETECSNYLTTATF